MAENASTVYDIHYPSPIPLKDLSAITVAIELWRLDVNQYLKMGDFSRKFYSSFDPKPRITLRKVIPEMPSVIHQITEKYVQNLVSSTSDWLQYNYDCIFHYHRDNHNEILKDFDDIMCDCDGTIHYVRTAQRMMLCDRISLDEKFKIACAYCFEEDIRRIAPSALAKVNLDQIEYKKCSALYYWVCKLRNAFDEIPNEGNIPIGDLMLKHTPVESRSSFEYFWELAGAESRYQKAVALCLDDHLSFCGRFVLQKLNEDQLTTFVDEEGCDLIYNLWTDLEIETSELILATWAYIKDKMHVTGFAALIEKMLFHETNNFFADYSLVEKSEYDRLYHISVNLTTCCEIWTTAADELRRFAIKELLSNKGIFKKTELNINEPREVKLLMTVLQDASLEDRSLFWRKNWRSLLFSTLANDLHQIMNLCFANEEEINLFKKNTMAKYENLAKIVTEVIGQGYFALLDDALHLICSQDEQCRKDLKRKCLQSNFLNEHSILCIDVIRECETLHEFIEDAYADSANEFRDQFLSSPETEYQLFFCMQNGYFYRTKEFVESFASLGFNVEPLKKKFVDELRKYLIEGSVWDIAIDGFREFLLWCLGSDDKVTEFKQSISPEEVLHNMLENAKSSQENEGENKDGLLRYPRTLDAFLLWYFDTEEKINEFKTRLADVFKMFAAPKRRRC